MARRVLIISESGEGERLYAEDTITLLPYASICLWISDLFCKHKQAYEFLALGCVGGFGLHMYVLKCNIRLCQRILC